MRDSQWFAFPPRIRCDCSGSIAFEALAAVNYLVTELQALDLASC